MAITWGNIITGSKDTRKGKIGIEATINTSKSTNTTTYVTVSVYFASMYSLTDTNNTYYYNKDSTSATTSQGSVSINHSVATGSGWSSSNQTKIGSYEHSYTRTTSAQTKYFAAKITGIDNFGASNVSSVYTSVSVPALASYAVSYNANGGSGAPSNQTKWYGTALTLSSTKPTRTGYSFSKWNTAANGSGTSYNSGASYTGNTALNLYAQWTANTYTVTFNANGGTGAPANQTKTYGVNLTLSSTIPTRTNYNFLGWATTSNATTAEYSAGSTYTTNAATTLYAVWEVAYIKPRITNFTVDRCNQDGTPSDTGTYALVKFDWECDLEVSNVRIEWKVGSSSSYSGDNGKDISSSGKSGSVSEIIGNGSLSAEYTYNIRVGVADSVDSNNDVKNLNPMVLPIDILVGGTGVSIGKPATLNETFDVAWNTQINGDLSNSGDAIIGGSDSIVSLNGEVVKVSTDMHFAHGFGIYGQNADNVERSLMHINTSNQYIFGYGGYSNSEGTSIYYGNEVAIRSKGAIAITSPTAGLNARQYGVNKVLWSGAAYMNGSQSVTLSEAISAQPNGVILIWSYYQNSAAESTNIVHTFVPKYHVSVFAGRGMNCSTLSTDGNMWKYLYISDTSIAGYASNHTNPTCGGVATKNINYVLRYVIGV